MPKYNKKCCVPNCQDMESKRHRFPKSSPYLFDLWLKNIGNDKLNALSKDNVYKSYMVCEKHFEEHCIVPGTRRGLVVDSIPTLFLTEDTVTVEEEQNEKLIQNDHDYCMSANKRGSSKEIQQITISQHLKTLDCIDSQPSTSGVKLGKSRPEDAMTVEEQNEELTQNDHDYCMSANKRGSSKENQQTSTISQHLETLDCTDSQPSTSGVKLGKSRADTHGIIETSRECENESDSALGNVTENTFTETVGEAYKLKLTVPVPNETCGTPAEKPVPVKQVLQLRLIDDDDSCDEPIYEVVTDDETNKKHTATQTAVKNSHAKDSQSTEDDVQYAPTVTSAEGTEPTCEKYKNKEYWKLKFKHILHNTQFCGVCLETDVDMNALNDVFEITDVERTHRRSLRDIVAKVFKAEGHCPANSQICNNCTQKLIESYIFIHNAEETLKMLDLHLDELYTKTCYVSNNTLRDASNAHSRIYNVVIALDNKAIAGNFESSQIKIENPELHQNEKEQIQKRLRCVRCNVVLPSYRAWKIHERTAHEQSPRCRICLQSYKTQRALTAHYKTHLKSRCALCHRTVQDGELLQHLNTRHKHSVHSCTTCNVALYSAKALRTHIKECHRREDSKCVTCLQSLSRVELGRHQCRFKCPECEEAPCVHHRHLMWYREQMANLAPRAKCAECRYVCTSKEALVAHVNRQHLSLQPHRCASCGHHFYCKSELHKHICASEKGNKVLHVCQYCDKAFSSLYNRKLHKKQCESVQRKYQCDDCPANFDSSKDHMKHRKLKHGKEFLSCSFCDRVFLNDVKRIRHERQAHGKQRSRASLVCVVCQTEFLSKAALKLHMRYHGPEANCQLDTLGLFRSHRQRHKRSLAVCEVCGVVISRILLKKHMIAHSVATVSCKTCGKSFQSSTLLRYHQSVHVKSASCPRCKKLVSPGNLWRHFRKHLIRESLDFKVAAIHGL